MKIKHAVAGMTMLLSAQFGFSQIFEQTISKDMKDFNHYSIEQAEGGGYICAGTLFDDMGNTDIHVLKLDNSGAIVWEQEIDLSDSDRALDVVVNPFGEIVITGHISSVLGVANLYLAKFSASGVFMGDKTLDNRSYSTFGTNIIYSHSNASYIVGGLRADDINIAPVTNNAAILLEFDLCLGLVQERDYGLTKFSEHSAINDIVEVPNGYFITGSIEDPTSSVWGIPRRQGVLALFIDGNFDMKKSFCYTNSNDDHCGVSAVYAEREDMIVLMSNNSILHNPEILLIDNASSLGLSSSVVGNYFVDIYNSLSAASAAGFQLELVGAEVEGETHLSDGILLAGYLRDYDNGMTNDNSPAWTVHLDAMSGSMLSQPRIFDVPSPNFYAHGGGLFSTFDGEAPYLFNQEILCRTGDDFVFAVVGPRAVGPKYGIDVFTVDLMSEIADCYETFEPEFFESFVYIELVIGDFQTLYGLDSPWANLTNSPTHQWEACQEHDMAPEKEESGENDAQGINSITTNEERSFTAFPSPAVDIVNLTFEKCPVGGVISILSIEGKTHFTSQALQNCDNYQLNFENYEAGSYIIQLTINGENKTQTIIKK